MTPVQSSAARVQQEEERIYTVIFSRSRERAGFEIRHIMGEPATNEEIFMDLAAAISKIGEEIPG